ncbi:bacteriohemerythrin [Succinispira mobilis]|uniref:bacteriohemerythrin n=1 Tax=Succinispira mobilis TaxID=78120 RepID=UPI00035E2126|nr:hemerythrin family protein [Succinispira mobilis]
MIYWKKEYELGLVDVDKQHKYLIDVAVEAYELLKNKLAVDKYDKIVGILQELRDYTIFHFEYEENFMKKNSYPKFLSHKMEHKKFIDKINAVDLSTIDENQEEALLSILEFIATWLESHILETDKRVANYLQENNG